MIVTFKPENGSGGHWAFDWRRVPQSQAEMIERRAGGSWDQWLAGVRMGNSKARRVLLWHLNVREHPAFRWEDTPDFFMGELDVEMELPELRELRDAVAKGHGDNRDEILDLLDKQIEGMELEARVASVEPCEAAVSEDENGGKAPSPSSGTDTAWPSASTTESVPGSSTS